MSATQYAVLLDMRSAQKRATAAVAEATELGDELCRMVNHLVAGARTMLDVLDNLTSEQFAQGADRPGRAALVAALARCEQASPDELREYRDEIDDHGPGCDGPLNCVCGEGVR